MATEDPEKLIVVEKPLHILIGPVGFTVTVGVGLMVMLNVRGIPLHEFEKGVTVTSVCKGVPVIFVLVNAFILPVPESGRAPTLILVLTQLKVAPAIVVGTKTIGSVNTPLHLICGVGITISGAAFAV